jgi:OHCU decarboxylase
VTLSGVNGLDCKDFVWALGWVFEDSPWVAERAWVSRPFATVKALHEAMVDVVRHASREEQLAMLCAHPDLGTRARVSAASEGEQKGAGLDSLTESEFAGLQQYNQQYREKFGFPFIYAVKGSGKGDVLLALTLRCEGQYEDELHQALWEVGRIAWFRLEQMFV